MERLIRLTLLMFKIQRWQTELNFIVETKDVGSDDGLREEEKAKLNTQKNSFGQVKLNLKHSLLIIK